ncbi:hypothetical protein FXN61_43990 [Lentzea sp. PSKA42]|uniref:Carboxypeptidase regulatory-like domain-containing protein n=1 Tax=Lentzea indica TaxID=2604800 RepID=A0ABX1FWA0_9PSEU|nr:hypothetical protein [Lentzea indica]NKE63318.1 hypothetical protein [Lentzea indica]
MTSPFDAEDLRVLDELRELYTALEPMPPGLVECAQFAVDLEASGFDIARIEDSEPLMGAGARSGSIRQITFDCGDLAVMVQFQVRDTGDVRIDGWLSPPGDHRVELRTATGTVAAETSPQGRFVIEGVRRGLVQFVVRAAGHPTVVTPAVVL